FSSNQTNLLPMQSIGPVTLLKVATAVSLAADFDGTGGSNDVAILEPGNGFVFVFLNVSATSGGAPTITTLNLTDLFQTINAVPTSATSFKDAITGLNDIAIADIASPTGTSGSGQIIVGINDGTGNFFDIRSFRQSMATPGATNLVNGDFNNDGFEDLAYI